MLRRAVILMMMFLCCCSATFHFTEQHDLDNARQQLSETSTTDELVDLICSCRADERTLGTRKPADCHDIKETGANDNGQYTVYPSHTGVPNEPLHVWCDMETDGGGWTVIQRRQDGSVDFDLGWQDYKNGFGFLGGEFWLGNENIHDITNQREYELRVEMQKYDGSHHLVHYNHFRIAEESKKYMLLTRTYTGTDEFCDNPLGMVDGTITDAQITASSQNSNAAYAATKARLTSAAGSWIAGTSNAQQWIQVKFGAAKLITGVITQGRYNTDHWVTKYKVQYSNNGSTWQYVKQPNKEEDMVFGGNADRNTEVTNYFAVPVKAVYVRIQPTTWQGAISMRFELLGCEGDFLAYQNNQAFSTKDADNDAVADFNCAVTRSAWWYGTCEGSDLNAEYLRGSGVTTRGIIWKDFLGQQFSLKRTEMKIRPLAGQHIND